MVISRRGDTCVSRTGRHVRPGLVGHRRRPVRADLARLSSPSGPVYLPEGTHTVVFTYRPAGFELGLCQRLSELLWACPLVVAFSASRPACAGTRGLGLACAVADMVVLVSGCHRADLAAGRHSPSGLPRLHNRWKNSVHTHTWGAGIAAMKANRL